ncbi:2-C-methyl-D-erythritol 4-phosphate cytidylyltransferase [Desulfacinum hydrothermale DSM 13146]|uniref:2-C-methyl-D-erythritol 4-phosphate cytidylyltransferase n=1 Tax=Desulfacinum hydrothermale DSM 13146 TaxID=1121390 RepID=A0A1W1WYG9_9BACT|nr:2-C-methyl-D-erythritol 4-phosphate cytidylyltransferase [Desulfacinum hydrothermale]SMC16776.1 2-C-methyl-D-erythritol 4-phosphate cytidylyltransferase [Desulfacinum hydrothermale DSM 13146]
MIVAAAGSGVRMGLPHPKQFHDLEGKPLLARTLDILHRLDFLSGAVVVAPQAFVAWAQDLVETVNPPCPVRVVAGGRERQDSVRNGLDALPSRCRWVCIHDGVRPFASPQLFRRTLAGAQKTGAAICACPAVDTVKLVRDGLVETTLNRRRVWLVQTPQVFRRDVLTAAYDRTLQEGLSATDDAALVERCGVSVAVVEGERTNVKITCPEDLHWAAAYWKEIARGGPPPGHSDVIREPKTMEDAEGRNP